MSTEESKVHKEVKFSQVVAILLDGNNIEKGIHATWDNRGMVLDFDKFVPAVLRGRMLSRITYFREGTSISPKLSKRLDDRFFGNTVVCNKSADVALTIEAVKLSDKVDTIVICSGDIDYLPLVQYLKSSGVRVELAVVKNSLSGELAKHVDGIYYIELNDTYDIMAQKKPI